MSQVIEVLASEHKEGIGRVSKDKYSMDVVQAVVRDGASVFVGELILPKGHAVVAPGRYMPEFDLAKSFDGKVTGRIARLVAVKG